jgi:hypothetical protein
VNQTGLAIGLVVAVGAAALAARMFGRRNDDDAIPPPPAELDAVADEPESDEVPDDEVAPESRPIAMTSDGSIFMAEDYGVRVLRPPAPEDAEPPHAEDPADPSSTADPLSALMRGSSVDRRARLRERELALSQDWSEGDLVAARVRRGAEGGGWCVEALGRDLDYEAWTFETEDGARAAADLLTERVVRAPEGAEYGDADYDASLRRTQTTIAELATATDSDPPYGDDSKD